MKTLLMTVLVVSLLITACSPSVTPTLGIDITAKLGPAEVTVGVDQYGKVSVTSGFVPKVEIGLGPITLEVGIKETLVLANENPYTLYVIWADEQGEIRRLEYEIGRQFTVKFTNDEHIREITGTDNNSVVVRVDVIQSAAIEQFIRGYFNAINARNYEKTWGMLSSRFQATHKSFQHYTSFWDTVANVNVLAVNVDTQDSNDAYVFVKADYSYMDGKVENAHTTYQLIFQEGSWFFEPKN